MNNWNQILIIHWERYVYSTILFLLRFFSVLLGCQCWGLMRPCIGSLCWLRLIGPSLFVFLPLPLIIKKTSAKRCTHGCHRESSAFTWCSAGICGLTEGSCLWSDLLRSLQRSCCHWEWWGGSSTTKKPRVNTEGWTVTMTNLVIRCEVKSYIIYG